MSHILFISLTVLTAPDFAVRAVDVFDGEGLRAAQNVVIRDGRVETVSEEPVPRGLEVIDGRGKTLLPGLIDAHVHTFGNALADAARFGVTTVLDMFTAESLASAERARRATLEDSSRADLYSSGFLATSDGGHGTEYGIEIPTLSGPEDAYDWVRDRVRAGADYIKIVYQHPDHRGRFTSIDRETLAAMVDAAHTWERQAIVHVQEIDSARDAVRAGADGLAHTPLEGVATAGLLVRMERNDTFVLSTLGVFSGLAPKARPRLPPALRDRLSSEQRQTLDAQWPGPTRPEAFADAQKNVALFRGSGIPILAGSDAPNPGTAHGVSLLTELFLLVEAGLTAREALASATSVPARIFGLVDRGRIRPGSRADLLLVRGDPTRDIRNIAEIEAVWKNGYPVPLVAKAPEAEGLGPMVVSDFDENLESAWGVPWSASADDMMGGASEAEVSRGEGRAKGGLEISGTLRPGFMAPWSGAFVSFARDWSKLRDLSAIEAVSFDVRGTPGTYRFMIFGEAMNAPPRETSFEVTEKWQRVRIPVKRFEDAAGAVRAFGLSASPGSKPKTFEIAVDDVRFE